MLRPDCLVRVRKNDSFPSFRMRGWRPTGENPAALLGERGRERSYAAFFLFFTFFFQEKNLRADRTRSSIRTVKRSGDCKYDTLTTTPNSLVIKLVSGAAHSREHTSIHSRKKGWGGERKLHFVFSHWLWLSSKLY